MLVRAKGNKQQVVNLSLAHGDLQVSATFVPISPAIITLATFAFALFVRVVPTDRVTMFVMAVTDTVLLALDTKTLAARAK
jgi:hypothetical protein